MESSDNGSNKGKRPTKGDGNKSCDSASSSDKLNKGATKEKRLKKDDSGINVLPESDNSEGFSDSEVNSSSEIKTLESLNASEPNSPDSGNVESSCSIRPAAPQTMDKDFVIDDFRTLNEINSDVSDSEDEVSEIKPIQSVSDSDDSDSDDLEIGDNKKRKKSNRKGKNKYDPTPNTPRPVHHWSAPKNIISRQYGTSSKYSPDLFRHKCYGSLHMVQRLELMFKMQKHDGCVNTLNFNSTGTKLVSGSDDLNVIIWDWTTSESPLVFNSGHTSNVFMAKFVPQSGDCHVVTCARDGQVRIAELSSDGTCKGTRKLGQHKGASHKLAVQKDSPHIFLSCAEDGLVYLYDLRIERSKDNPQKLITFMENEKRIPLYSIAINPQRPNEYVVGGRSPYVKVYDIRFNSDRTACLKTFCPEHLENSNVKANVTAAVYNYNGEEILASYSEDIYLFSNYETVSSKYLHRYRGHRNSQTIKGVNFFGSKSEFVVSGSDCGYIFFWEKESEHIVKYMYGDEMGVVNVIEPHPNMPVLASSGLDDDIKIWVPSCENEPDFSKLKTHIISNLRSMDDETQRESSDTFVDQTIMFLMQHLSRYRPRDRPSSWAERENIESNSSSSDSEPPDEDSDIQPGLQCSQS